jgi:hypothetical protein
MTTELLHNQVSVAEVTDRLLRQMITNDENGRRERQEVLSYLEIFWSTLTNHENMSQDKTASRISEWKINMIYLKLCHNDYIALVNE